MPETVANGKERPELQQTPLPEDINLRKMAEKHAVSGGTVINVVRYCPIKATKCMNHTIMLQNIEQ